MKHAKKTADPIGALVSKIGSGIGGPVLTALLTAAMVLAPVPLPSIVRADEVQPSTEDSSEPSGVEELAETEVEIVPNVIETVEKTDAALVADAGAAAAPRLLAAPSRAAESAEPTIAVMLGGETLADGAALYIGASTDVVATVSDADSESEDLWTLAVDDASQELAAGEDGGGLQASATIAATDGTVSIQVLCNGEAKFSASVVVDTKDPVPSATFEGVATPCKSGTITVSVADDNLDLDATYAQLLDGEGNAVGEKYDLATDGTVIIDISADTVADGTYSGVMVHAADKVPGRDPVEKTFSSSFEVDKTAPTVTAEYYKIKHGWLGDSRERLSTAPENINYELEVEITIADPNFTVAYSSEEPITLANPLVEGADEVSAVTDNGDGTYTVTATFHKPDWMSGRKSISLKVTATDDAGNKTVENLIANATQDSTPPVVSVDFGFKKDTEAEGEPIVDNDGTAMVLNADGTAVLFKDSHDVTITVTDDNYTDLRGTSAEGTAAFSYTDLEGAEGVEKVELTDPARSGNTYTYEITLESERIYTGVEVEVTDQAGNTTTDADAYSSDEDGFDPEAACAENSVKTPVVAFEIDATDPVIHISSKVSKDGSKGDSDVYGREKVETITVTERNFDESLISIEKDGKVALSAWQHDGDTHTCTVTYAVEGTYTALTASGSDMVGHTAESAAIGTLIVDLNAPTVDTVTVSTPPSGIVSGAIAAIQFHSTSTTMTIEFSDTYGVESAKVTGYDADVDTDAGTATIILAEGQDFSRDVLLTLVDYAGNQSIWSIKETGEAKLIRKEDVENPANTIISLVVGNVEHPELLVLDTTAPVVTLDGATAGTYYASNQTITAEVVERNFAYTQSHDGSQVLVTISFTPGQAGAATQSITVPAASFAGSDSAWSYSRTLSDDGHYSVMASMRDIAGNQSNTATIGEFTIDQTAPTIEVSFDNNDVRNGKYYNAGRTATITVVEHNFDASLMSITTNGSVGAWSTSGDTHTCTVSFSTDGTYNLSVSGSDRAGNAAAPYTADEFVVDLTAPQITIANFDGSDMDQVAYDGTVAPVITFTDEANLDTSDAGTTWVLERANGAAGDPAAASSPFSGNTRVVSWDDFAHQISVDDIYTLSAHMSDLAGNEAEAQVEFSVNRFGSTFQILDVSTEKGEWDAASAERQDAGNVLLASSPTIAVREINVSGSSSQIDPENAHFVDVEHANATNSVQLVETAGAGSGYLLDEGSSHASGSAGWAEYNYTILSGNFGEENSAYASDGGQGSYNVTVGSYDRTNGIVRDEDGNVTSYGRVNTSGIFFGNEDGQSIESQASVGFILDEKGPEIVSIDVPEGVEVGETYRVTVAVRDDVGGESDVLTASINGTPVEADAIESNGTGIFSFDVDAAVFGAINASSIDVTVTDYDGRADEASAKINLTTMVAEGVTGAAALAAAIGGIVVSRRRKNQETV